MTDMTVVAKISPTSWAASSEAAGSWTARSRCSFLLYPLLCFMKRKEKKPTFLLLASSLLSLMCPGSCLGVIQGSQSLCCQWLEPPRAASCYKPGGGCVSLRELSLSVPENQCARVCACDAWMRVLYEAGGWQGLMHAHGRRIWP